MVILNNIGFIEWKFMIFMFIINLFVCMYLWDNEGGIMNDYFLYIWIVYYIVGYNLGNIIY